MCGIAGIVGDRNAAGLIQDMITPLRHRGPDAEGIYANPGGWASIGHRRLSIIDLSSIANQPMLSENKRFAMVFNGEIYNFQELAGELKKKGYCFRSKSDTEALLYSYMEWGPACVERLIGMYAFAVWDNKEGRLFLCRDRIGVKPLYYSVHEKTLVFASEMRSILALSFIDRELSKESIGEFLELGYVRAPNTIFKGIKKLRPGAYMVVQGSGVFDETRYWTVEGCYKQEQMKGDIDSISEELEAILLDSFKNRMISDVPVGLFLSGGVDSTLLAALLSKRAGAHLKTFTIGFKEDTHDEAMFAQETSFLLKTDHTEKYFSDEDLKGVVTVLPKIYDEPLADTSALPTILVSGLASQSVKVVLSADGGDELFMGYRRYLWSKNYENTFGLYPGVSKRIGKILNGFGSERVTSIYNLFSKLSGKKIGTPKEKIEKFFEMLDRDSSLERYLQLNRIWGRREIATLLGPYSINDHRSLFDSEIGGNFLNILAAYDTKYYLPDDILMKLDRATMSFSIEGRDPFLDHRIIEFSARVPLEMKIKDGKGKYILRHILKRYVPEHIVDRPKKGFSIPIAAWFGDGKLTTLMERYLNQKEVENVGLFDPDYVGRMVADLKQGDNSLSGRIYSLIVFLSWKDYWKV